MAIDHGASFACLAFRGALLFFILPHPHSSGNFAGHYVDSVYNDYRLQHIYCLELEPHWGLQHHHLHTLVSKNIQSTVLHLYTAKVHPGLLGVVILYGSLVYNHIFLGVIAVSETISVPYTEPMVWAQCGWQCLLAIRPTLGSEV